MPRSSSLHMTFQGIRTIDLHGHTANPGLIDTHAHIADGGTAELCGIKLSDATSVAEIVARVKSKVASAKAGEWITGSGWDEGKLADHRYVTAADLDPVSPNNPVWLIHTTGHFSKKGTRRWCSMRLCGNRLKVAAYAARQRWPA